MNRDETTDDGTRGAETPTDEIHGHEPGGDERGDRTTGDEVRPADGTIALDDVSLRVLGSLIEKSKTTPDNYPLTLNSLRLACNQSTSREPVVEYGEVEIEGALARLRERGFTRTVHSTSNRGAKYRHVAADALGRPADDADADLAVLAVLMLRGPQTPGQLKTRTERQHGFDDLDEVHTTLARLADGGLVIELERQPGQKDARWAHLLGETPPVAPAASPSRRDGSPTSASDPYGEVADAMQIAPWTFDWDEFVEAALDELIDLPPSGSIVVLGATTVDGLAVLSDAVIAGSPDRRLVVVEPSPSLRAAIGAASVHDRRVDAVCVPDWDTALAVGPVIAVVFGWIARVPVSLRAAVWRGLPSTAPALVATAGARPADGAIVRHPVADVTYSVVYDAADSTSLGIDVEVRTSGGVAVRDVGARVPYAPLRPAGLDIELAPFGLAAAWHRARTDGEPSGVAASFVGGAIVVRHD